MSRSKIPRDSIVLQVVLRIPTFARRQVYQECKCRNLITRDARLRQRKLANFPPDAIARLGRWRRREEVG